MTLIPFYSSSISTALLALILFYLGHLHASTLELRMSRLSDRPLRFLALFPLQDVSIFFIQRLEFDS